MPLPLALQLVKVWLRYQPRQVLPELDRGRAGGRLLDHRSVEPKIAVAIDQPRNTIGAVAPFGKMVVSQNFLRRV